MLKTKKSFLLGCLIAGAIPSFGQLTTQSKVDYVNPYIGSEGHGHVFVGADVPFGAVQLGPTQIGQTWDKFNGWDWCSGYNYISRDILGFTHTHLSGTGIGDLNDIMIVPANGPLLLEPMKFNQPGSGYGSLFKKETEVVHPGYYEVYLDNYKVKAQLSATERVGIHQYHYEKTDNAHILVDLGFHMNWDMPTQTSIKKIDNYTFVGQRFSKGWANDQRLFFVIKLNKPVANFKLFDSSATISGNEANGKYIKAALFFDAQKNPDIELKVAISPVSVENAILNLNTEAKDWNFGNYVAQAQKKWNDNLNRIEIEAPDNIKTLFYTSLFHMYIGPTLFNDVNKDYRGTDKKVYPKADFQNVTTMSLWDSYRAWSPFMTIAEPSMMKNVAASVLAIYQQQGRLPVWPLMGCETDCMVGNPGIIVVADAFLKGLIPKNKEALAYEAVTKTATRNASGLDFVTDLKFIPLDSLLESVSWAMEYAIADAGIARMAKKKGKTADAIYYEKRSKLYTQYYDDGVKFFNGRHINGNFRTPFDPISALHRQTDYTEGNAWQYLWLVPQDVHGLVKLLGGESTFEERLDHFLTMSSNLKEGSSPDIAGMIGQYAQGNEPSHHIAYLYTYIGKPYKTADLLRTVTDSFYTTKPDGLIGNEDVGQMSAWYAFNALGMYSVDPTSGIYVFGTPLVDKATIHLENGKTFRINVLNNSKENKYIQFVTLDRKNYPYSYLTHKQIMNGGTLVFNMGAKPSKFGTDKKYRP
ncbi:GH92 family glycosyl hydrolase [Rhizosphaericola mali]|uniref:Glycoside hydrolase family 92 protein n=1 Tax=Rhizosphaericola mali TaxID=2545455 RepID=A0A5P2G5Z0_9BACT|nr:GH92 family glycosyl hydrolase [Rhizosphaericola mali]QES89292.1 glycoside hydrolase family 92 protein [Rhizosphaericola mali]